MSIPQNSSKTLMVSGSFFVKLAGRMIRHHTVNFDDDGKTCMRALNILLVDDDRNLVTTLSHGLRKAMGQEVSVAVCFSGSEALSLLGNQAFDTVISDYNMPGTSGLELLKTIRQEDGEMILVLTTAYGTGALEEGETPAWRRIYDQALRAIVPGANDQGSGPKRGDKGQQRKRVTPHGKAGEPSRIISKC